METQKFVIVGIYFLAVFSVKDIWGFTDPQLINIDKPGGTVKTLCSSGCTFSSLSQADGSVGAGNTLKIKAGTYSATSWDESNVVMEAYGDGVATISGTMDIYGDNIIIDGLSQSSPQLRFAGPSSGYENAFKIKTGAENITISKCDISGGYTTILVTATNVKFYNNKIHDGREHNLYLSHCENCEVKNNIVHDPAMNCIQTNPHDGTTVRNTEISGNAIYGAGESGMTILSGTGTGGLLEGLLIKNNLVWDCGQVALRFTGESSYVGTIRNVEVYGNTLYGNVRNDHGVSGKPATTKFKNNIVTGSITNTGGFIEYSNNVIGSTSCLASTSSSSSDFLKLKSTASDCINSGATGLGLTSDYFANSRDSVPDIGAHEYGGGTPPDTTTPAAPSGLRVR